ncbi:hypothetical protein [Micromonospora globbae]|uniref:hypothetical protein n=1 Tax=Micromonospora globbae TaxID=1894969 RepID=UPI00386A81D0|nr:hypothetical protein OH732_01685 [Micromonospora globbae]
MRAWMRVAGAVAGLTLAAGTAACTGADVDPVVAPTGPATTAVPSGGGPAPADGPLYHADGLDLCGRTDLAVLADLGLTVTRTDPTPPAVRPGAACLFEMRTSKGYEANLRVEASTPGTVEEARRLYRGTGQATTMRRIGAVDGAGEEAEAFGKQSEPGFRYAEYMVHSRTGNLVVKVWLAVGGDSYVPTSTLAEKSLDILAATRSAVPTG